MSPGTWQRDQVVSRALDCQAGHVPGGQVGRAVTCELSTISRAKWTLQKQLCALPGQFEAPALP